MNEIKWTRKTPKVPGWYWFKGQKASVKIVEIIELRMLGLQFNDARLPRDLKVWPGKWSGPIPPPSEK